MSKYSIEFVLHGSALTRSGDLVICGTQGYWKFTIGLIPGNSIVELTPINYWLRIYEYYAINSINRLVPVGKGEGERCDEQPKHTLPDRLHTPPFILDNVTLIVALQHSKAL